jgi:hypothetical protein
MTALAEPGTGLARPEDFATGLEDFNSEDLKLPRLSINHENGTFKDSLSNMEYEELVIIPLGLIKQRVLWPPQISDEKDAVPLCKSPDHKTGYPTIDRPNQAENFPWAATGWQPQMFQPNAEGRLILPCESCRLKEWKSHPDGKKTWCSEQHAIPLLYAAPGNEPSMTALFTAQRSSIAASKTFFAGVVRRQLPAFAVTAKLTLQSQMRGKNKFCVPIFVDTGLTDQGQWSMYSEAYKSIREFISRPPMLRDNSQPVNPAAISQGNVMQAQQFGNDTWVPQAQPVQQPVPSHQAVYPGSAQQYREQQQGYPPVGQPVQQAPVSAPPVQQAPAQVPAPMPMPNLAPPLQAPVVQQAPVQAPVVQQAPVQQPVMQSPPPSPSPARDEDDDLPF